MSLEFIYSLCLFYFYKLIMDMYSDMINIRTFKQESK